MISVILSDDDSVKAFLKYLEQYFEQREASFVKDGYEWKIVSFKGFIFTFSPRTEHRRRKGWSRKNKGETEAWKKEKARIDDEAEKLKKRNKTWVLNKKIKIGRRIKIKLPPWWFSKVGADITSEGNDCVSKMINAYFKKKKLNINEFLWGDCPHNGERPYTIKDLVKLNKINTKFYLCGWAYEGLDEKTYNIMFVNMLRQYIVPPTDTKGKTPIYFALATPKELCDKVDELKYEESRRQALYDFVIYINHTYVKIAYMFRKWMFHLSFRAECIPT